MIAKIIILDTLGYLVWVCLKVECTICSIQPLINQSFIITNVAILIRHFQKL